MEFEQSADGTISAEGILLQKSDPVRVRGLCLSCKHRWTLRGIQQILQLRKAFTKTPPELDRISPAGQLQCPAKKIESSLCKQH